MPHIEKSAKRRKFLLYTLKALVLVTLYPLYRFLSFVRPDEFEYVILKEPLEEGGYLIDKRFVLFNRGGELICVSRRCTHLGCIVNFVADEGIFRCPCHRSTFTWEGRLISGPATRDLPRLQVLLENDHITVRIPK